MVYIMGRTPDPLLLVSTGAFPVSVLCTSPPCRGLPVDLLRSSGVSPPTPDDLLFRSARYAPQYDQEYANDNQPADNQ